MMKRVLYDEARIVRQQRQAAAAGARVPADEGVTRGGLPRGRAEQHTGQRTPVTVADQILQIGAHGVAQTQIVVARNQTVEQLGVCGARRGRSDAQGRQGAQPFADRRGLMGHGGMRAVAQRVGRDAAAGRQDQVAGALEFEQQIAAGHVAPLTRGPPPVPMPAKLARELRAAPLGVFGAQPLDERQRLAQGDLGARQRFGGDGHEAAHDPHPGRTLPMSPEKNDGASIFFLLGSS